MQIRNSDITAALRMQALSIISMPQPFLDLDDFAVIPAKPDLQCNTIQEIHNDDETNIDEEAFSFSPIPAKLDLQCNTIQKNPNDNEKSIDEEEFSFGYTDMQGMPIFADEIFDNGKIRPFFKACEQSLVFTGESKVFSSPLRPPLKKILVKISDNFFSEPGGFQKESEKHPSQNLIMAEVKALTDNCKKSNSTGFSNLWKFRRHLKPRSKSDVIDTCLFLNPPLQEKQNEVEVKNVPKKKGNGEKCKTTLSAHEKLYVMNRMRKESNKRKSFLPYKQNLVGLFFNANTFSRNLHPY